MLRERERERTRGRGRRRKRGERRSERKEVGVAGEVRQKNNNNPNKKGTVEAPGTTQKVR